MTKDKKRGSFYEKQHQTEYIAPVEHPRPAKLNTCVADNEQHRRSSCTLTLPNLYDTIIMLYSQGG